MRRRRNTPAYTFLAWTSFALSLGFLLIGVWNTEWALVEKGFYSGCFIWAVSSAFTLAKVVRDNQEDKADMLEAGLTQRKPFSRNSDRLEDEE